MSTHDFPTFSQIRRHLPSHCFTPSLGLSLLYLARTVGFCVLFGCLFYLSRARWFGASALCDLVYALAQGTAFWGLFVIGHDCGHGSFSLYPWVNWCVGNVIHSAILTPYEAWRLSHRSHHANTCHLERDEIFYPNAPFSHGLITSSTLGGAWFWYILFKNVPGRKNYRDALAKPHGWALVISFYSWAGMFGLLWWVAQRVGWNVVVLYYGAPLFVFASWLVVVTFLHHNDETTPWYSESAWTQVKGALSSVDRDYGFIINMLSNNIHLHQIHHLFPAIPHYHLHEATAAFQKAFPHLTRRRTGSNIAAFYKNLRNWVVGSGALDKDTGIFYYGLPLN